MATSALDRRPRNDRPRWTARQSDSWLPLFRYRIAWRKPPSQPQSFLLERFRTGSNPARVGRVRTSRSLSGGVFEDLETISVSSRPGTSDGAVSGNLEKNAVTWSKSMRVSSPSRWETQTRTGAPKPAAPVKRNRQ